MDLVYDGWLRPGFGFAGVEGIDSGCCTAISYLGCPVR